MRRKIMVLLSATLLAVAALGFSAGAAQASCTQAVIVLYEHVGQSGNSLTVCYPTNITNMKNIGHPYAGLCQSSWPWEPDDWDNCISSFWFDERTVDTSVCLWTNSSFGGNGLKVVGDWGMDLTGGPWHDSITSVEWGNACHNSGTSPVP